MAKNILRSNNAAVLIGNGTGFSTSDLGVELYRLVQDFDYSIQLPRQELKELGSQDFVFRGLMRQPDVSLNFSYIPEPALANEQLSHFLDNTATSTFVNMFSGQGNFNNNFYVISAPSGNQNAIDSLSFDEDFFDLSGFDCIAFGNCFPQSYGISYGVGTLPMVSAGYICSNAVFENLTGESMLMPSINLTGGNNDNVGRCLFQIDPAYGTDPANCPIVNPTNTGSSIVLQNLEVGGQNLSGVHFVQSLDMSVELPRISSYGLGNDFAYNRKAQFPARGSFNVSSLVSGMDSGIMTGLLNQTEDIDYSFELALEVSGYKMIYQIEDAKLNSYNYAMTVNNMMSFSAGFGFEVTETKGLKMSGTLY